MLFAPKRNWCQQITAFHLSQRGDEQQFCSLRTWACGKTEMWTKQQLGFLLLFIGALGILCSFVFHGCLINKNTVHSLHIWGVIHRMALTHLRDPAWLSPGSTSSEHLEPQWQFPHRPWVWVVLLIIYTDQLKLCSHLYSYALRLSKMNWQSWKHSSLISPSHWFLSFSNNRGVWDTVDTARPGSPSILVCLLPTTLPSQYCPRKRPRTL